jgi:hypothetical protein
MLGVNIDTACGTREAVVLPEGKTLMVVHVTPPSRVRAAKLLAPSTIATSLLAWDMLYRFCVVPEVHCVQLPPLLELL